MLQRGFLLGGHEKPGAARKARQHRGGLDQDVLQGPPGDRQPFGDGALLFAGEIADLQHAIHEQPQAFLGRHPSGAGMGGIQEPHLLEISHDVADRGRRKRERQALGESPRTHRLARGKIGFDKMAKHLARPGTGLAAQEIGVNRFWGSRFHHIPSRYSETKTKPLNSLEYFIGLGQAPIAPFAHRA